jgi:hypothetical protein
MSLRNHCEKAYLPELAKLPEGVLVGLVETYLTTYPQHNVGEKYDAVMGYKGINLDGYNVTLRSQYQLILQILKELNKSSPVIQELLLTKVRHVVIYSGLRSRIKFKKLDISPLGLPQSAPWVKTVTRYGSSELIESEEPYYFESHDIDDNIRNWKSYYGVELPTLTETIELLEKYMQLDPIEDGTDNPIEHWQFMMIFGLGFSVEQSRAFIEILNRRSRISASEILNRIGKVPIDGDGSDTKVEAKYFFYIDPIRRGTYLSIEYDHNGDICDISHDNIAQGVDRGVEGAYNRIYSYRFM